MEGTMSEIRMFAPHFAPKDWDFCAGQVLAINVNQALFSLLGTNFGGNGLTTFGLPDLRGRVPVGTGNSTSGLTQRVLGEVGGVPAATLLLNQIPQHTHNGNVSGSGKLLVSSADASLTGPATGSSIASPIKATGRSKTDLLGFNNAQPNVALGNATINASQLTANINAAGASQPHSNMQPYLGINYIICLRGVFPSRG
ncbi:MAG: phage tail protein [Sphingobacteriales bacterium]|nr:MAG: phage tail protein [Sphingobacteriales bacterium]